MTKSVIDQHVGGKVSPYQEAIEAPATVVLEPGERPGEEELRRRRSDEHARMAAAASPEAVAERARVANEQAASLAASMKATRQREAARVLGIPVEDLEELKALAAERRQRREKRAAAG